LLHYTGGSLLSIHDTDDQGRKLLAETLGSTLADIGTSPMMKNQNPELHFWHALLVSHVHTLSSCISFRDSGISKLKNLCP